MDAPQVPSTRALAPWSPCHRPPLAGRSGIAGAKLDRDVDDQDTGVAGGGEQAGGLAQHVVVLHHLGEAEVLERALFVDDVVLEVHDQQGGVTGVEFQSHDVLHSLAGGGLFAVCQRHYNTALPCFR